MAAAGPLSAQAPPTSALDQPAATRWSANPQPPSVNVQPYPETPGTPRTVTYQKPANATAPVAARPAAYPRPVDEKKLPPQPVDKKPVADELPTMSTVTSGLPTRADIFRFDSDAALDKRMLTELKKENEKFPPVAPVVAAGVKYTPKTLSYPPAQVLLEPNYVVHRRLYFEEMNGERAGWDAGAFQPIISSMYFYRDALLWPHHLASNMHERYDASAGKCFPGDPTPYYYYPPGYTITGSAFEMVVLTTAAIVIFP